MNQDTLQHFPPVPPQYHFHTQDCISQTVWCDLKVALVLMHWDICMYIGYQQFGFDICWRRNWNSHLSLRYNIKGLICAIWMRHVFSSRNVASSFLKGLLRMLINSFRPHVALGSTQPLTQMSAKDDSLGIKATVRTADIFTIFMCQLCRKSERLKLLEPSHSVQACTGMANVIPYPEKFYH